MSSDSDMAQAFNDMKAEKKERRQKRLGDADPKGWLKHSSYHWYRMIGGEKIDYWPSTGLVIFKGKRMSINSNRCKSLIGKSECSQ